jgi:Ni,Fe-hydrogenase III large subunit
MLRKFTYAHRLITDGGGSRDPADDEIIQGVYKKSIREGEERLILAVLESAVEDFQKYVLARNVSGKKLFQEAEEWFLEKIARSFSPLGVSARSSGCIPTTYGKA